MGFAIDRDKLHRAWQLWDVGDWDGLKIESDKDKPKPRNHAFPAHFGADAAWHGLTGE